MLYKKYIMGMIFTGTLLSMVAGSGLAADLKVSSSVKGFHIVATTDLPQAPQSETTNKSLSNCRVDPPETAAGKIVAGQGWHVMSEVEAGNNTIISFFSEGEDGTSGSCFVKNGNVGIFEGNQLKAIVYDDVVKKGAWSSIGRVSSTNQSNVFRLSEYTPGDQPVVDLYISGNLARIQPLALVEPFCKGMAPVPNVVDKPVERARQQLMGYGWSPIPGDDEHDSRLEELRSKGIIEGDACSGTGFGFCEFSYKRESGASLNITTVGDDFMIANYGVTCPKE